MRGYLLGCRFINQSTFIKHADAVRNYFRIADKYQQSVNTLMTKVRKSGDVIVGVHIRRGDYKGYIGGRYFYEIEQYVKIMEQTENLFPNKKVAFLVCSDEQQKREEIAKFNVTFANNNIIEDMYSLAQCDYIFGPPSTYSVWASFYGEVPLYKIVSPDKVISLDNFEVYQIPLLWKD